jgi:hypothetical protein
VIVGSERVSILPFSATSCETDYHRYCSSPTAPAVEIARASHRSSEGAETTASVSLLMTDLLMEVVRSWQC